VLQFSRQEAGYATLTAIVLCAAVSILCAGAITLADSHRRIEARKLERLQRAEAINSAVMQFAIEIASSPERYALRGARTISINGKSVNVALAAQAEYAKWPLLAVDAVSPAHLAKTTRLSLSEIERRVALKQSDDCIETMFSIHGRIDPSDALPKGKGPRATSAVKDGQLWRIRAVSGTIVEERRVRFLGDPDHLFALVSVYRTNLGDMPECADLTETN
jgi:hypothetical protein